MAAPFLFPLLLATAAYATPPQRSNVLFIAIDDLNHWVGYLGRTATAKSWGGWVPGLRWLKL